MRAVDPTGLRVVAFSEARLLWAAQALAEMSLEKRMALKVRAGEHLAAIVMTACFGQPLTDVDRGGQADLTYAAVPEGRTYGLAPPGNQAIEVKSLGSSFRRYEATSSVGDVHELVVESAAALIAGAQPNVSRAALQLQSHAANGRHVFLVVHPLEHMVAETFANPFTIGAALGDVHLPRVVNALWVLFHPDQVVVWSRALRAWTQILFLPGGRDERTDENLTPLQEAEDLFLAALPGGSLSSPFLYVLRTEADD